jgi:hypothetical protein
VSFILHFPERKSLIQKWVLGSNIEQSDGPLRSRSIRHVFFPVDAKATARFIAILVFPVPPLEEWIANVSVMLIH